MREVTTGQKLCVWTEMIYLFAMGTQRIREEYVQLALGVLDSLQNVLCLSWKLFWFLEFIFLGFKHKDRLLLFLEQRLRTLHFSVFSSDGYLWNETINCLSLHVMTFLITRAPLPTSVNMNTPVMPSWVSTPSSLSLWRVCHPAACPPYLEYLDQIADLLFLIALSVNQ